MTRHTSAESYAKIKSQGLLGKLQWNVYDALYRYGPRTEGEIWKMFEAVYQRHSIAPRVAELKRMGLVYETGIRACALTGRNCIAWDVTDGMPIIVERRYSKDDEIKSLRERIKYLEKFIEERLRANPQQELGI